MLLGFPNVETRWTISTSSSPITTMWTPPGLKTVYPSIKKFDQHGQFPVCHWTPLESRFPGKCKVIEVSKTSHSPRQCHARLNLFAVLYIDVERYRKTLEDIGTYRKISVGFAPPKKKHVTRASPTLENHHDPLDVRRLVCDSCNLKATTGLFIEKVFWTVFLINIVPNNWTTKCSKTIP